ncbi:MAG TPA: KpsF/GutQ family sugar-phosphate isomerase [Ginsengibacter sp.]|nr:KpsF/GutQ family sugar-phosphate isomerase [Ginsengibacter sp.]HRP17175.1 KpsF/GutQ family sugar-phosphate isomerase [Ginsengibacter sp.]HRP43300.1 KpsF/GutQ family sugar-phosphate isomerase [Ginsengibacter sp.]
MNADIISVAKAAIVAEAESVQGLLDYVNSDFENIVGLVFKCKGRIVISGIGKSALIAQKIVASMNSTGTPAIFLHAADALHGDLGMVQPDDVVMIISKSGESPEIKVLAQLIRNFGNKIIALCGNENSTLVRFADYFLNSTVSEEACPNNLAPTSSTTAQMVMGDALTVCLMKLRGFDTKDFARYHPGGALGKRLYLRVADLYIQNERPEVKTDSTIKEVIVEMTQKRLGATVVTDAQGHVAGIITDGDLRRMLEKDMYDTHITAKDIMSSNPKTINPSELAVNALQLMRGYNITQLVVDDEAGYKGIIHLHDLVREGII